MNTQIEVLGWDKDNGATVEVSTYNAGRRNRRNRWSVDEQGDDAGSVHDAAAYQFVKNPEDRRRIAGVVFNIGHVYEADVVIDDADGRFEHTLTVDATLDYQVISYYDHPNMRVKTVHVPGDVTPDTAEEVAAYEDEPGGPDPITYEELLEDVNDADESEPQHAEDDSDAGDEEQPSGDVEVAESVEE